MRRLQNRLGILMMALGLLMLVSTLFVPWWTATAKLPGGNAKAELSLYSFHFESSGFSCVTVLMFYAYGKCPLLGGEAGTAELSFYLFWSLVFLTSSFVLGMVWLLMQLLGNFRSARWLPSVSSLLNIVSNLAFVGGISAAGLKFVTGSALYGASEVLTWTVTLGFSLAVVSSLAQLGCAYIAFRRA